MTRQQVCMPFLWVALFMPSTLYSSLCSLLPALSMTIICASNFIARHSPHSTLACCGASFCKRLLMSNSAYHSPQNRMINLFANTQVLKFVPTTNKCTNFSRLSICALVIAIASKTHWDCCVAMLWAYSLTLAIVLGAACVRSRAPC